MQHGIDSSWVRHCPRRSGQVEERFVEFEQHQRRVCRDCGFVHYRNPKVVAAAIPKQDGRIWLLPRNLEPGLGM